jgi:prolyl oligopeptidase
MSILAQGGVVDVIHGVEVRDPYRWLEDRKSAETQGWLEVQKRILLEHVSQFPDANSLRSRVSEYLNVEVIEQPAKVGSRYFFRRRSQNQEQACLIVRDIVTGTERVLVDPSDHGPYVAVAIHRISEDGRILAYGLKDGGERSEEIHFVEVENGRELDNYLSPGCSRGLTFASDNGGFYYCQEPELAAQENLPHEIRYRRFEDSAVHDQVLFSMPRAERSRLNLISDNLNLGAIYIRDSDTGLKIDFYVAPRSADTVWHPIFRDKEPPYGPLLHHGKIYVASSICAPNVQVVELLEDGSEGRVVVPEWSAPMGSIRLTEDRLYVSYQVECTTVIHSRSWTGEFLGALPAQPEGSFGLLQS